MLLCKHLFVGTARFLWHGKIKHQISSVWIICMWKFVFVVCLAFLGPFERDDLQPKPAFHVGGRKLGLYCSSLLHRFSSSWWISAGFGQQSELTSPHMACCTYRCSLKELTSHPGQCPMASGADWNLASPVMTLTSQSKREASVDDAQHNSKEVVFL